MPVNDIQVGGEHYKDSSVRCSKCGTLMQHWDIAWQLNWNVFQIYVTKYLWRDKESILEDAKKARHSLDKYIELLEMDEEDGGPTANYVNQD